MFRNAVGCSAYYVIRHVDDIAVNDETLRRVFNVTGMMDEDGNIYFASGAMYHLDTYLKSGNLYLY